MFLSSETEQLIYLAAVLSGVMGETIEGGCNKVGRALKVHID